MGNPAVMSLTYEPILPGSHQPAFELLKSCNPFHWSEKVFVDCLTDNYFAIQAFYNEQLVGFYVGLKVLQEGTLMDIGIAPNIRGKGLGKELLAHFIDNCKKREISEIWLEVRESNHGAIGLYQSFDFILAEQRKDYYPTPDGKEDALIMCKTFFD